MMEQMSTIDSISLNSVFAFSLLLSVTSAIMCLRAWINPSNWHKLHDHP